MLRVCVILLALSSVPAGCGGKQEPGSAGDVCYRDADCKPGLICAAATSERVCTNDLTGLESTVEAPPMEMPPEPAAGGADASGGLGGSGAAGGSDPSGGMGGSGASGGSGTTAGVGASAATAGAS